MENIDIQLLTEQAQGHMRSGNLHMARTLYQQICRTDRDSPDAWMMLGALSGELGNSEEAVSCLRTAIVLRPDFSKAHYNLGNVLRGRGELHDALECFERAVALDPGYVEAWQASAGVHLMLGGFEQAESCCRRAVELVPASAAAYGQLGQVLAEAGKLEAAAEQFHRVTEITPGLASGWMSLGRMHQRMEQYTEAEAAIRRAIAIGADAPDSHEMHAL